MLCVHITSLMCKRICITSTVECFCYNFCSNVAFS